MGKQKDTLTLSLFETESTIVETKQLESETSDKIQKCWAINCGWFNPMLINNCKDRMYVEKCPSYAATFGVGKTQGTEIETPVGKKYIFQCADGTDLVTEAEVKRRNEICNEWPYCGYGIDCMDESTNTNTDCLMKVAENGKQAAKIQKNKKKLQKGTP